MNSASTTSSPAFPAARKRFPYLGSGLRWLVTLLVLVWGVRQISPSAILSSLQGIDPLAFGMALSASAAGLLCSVARWWLLLRAFPSAQATSFSSLLRLTWIGLFFNTFVPGNVGGDLWRAHRTRHLFTAPWQAYLIVSLERIVGLMGLGSLWVLGFFWLQQSQGLPVELGRLSAIAWLGLWTSGAALVLAFAPLLSPVTRLLQRRKIHARGADLSGVYLGSWLLSLGSQAAVVLSAHVLMQSLHPQGLTLAASFCFAPLAVLATYLPALAGIGPREMTFAYLFSTLGFPRADAVAASLALLATQLVFALSGGLLYLLRLRFAPFPDSERRAFGDVAKPC
mgnify:CR=1 FL=1